MWHVNELQLQLYDVAKIVKTSLNFIFYDDIWIWAENEKLFMIHIYM